MEKREGQFQNGTDDLVSSVVLAMTAGTRPTVPSFQINWEDNREREKPDFDMLPTCFSEEETKEVLHAFRERESQVSNRNESTNPLSTYESEFSTFAHEGDMIYPYNAGSSESAQMQYTLLRQRHRGPRHGRGGRKRGKSVSERRKHVSPEVAKVMARTSVDVCGGSISTFCATLKESIQRSHPLHVWPADGEHLLSSLMCDMVTGKTSQLYEVFPSPYFAVCTKVSYSQVGDSSLGAMDRHAICTWLGKGGQAMCSCIGSTRFRMTFELGIIQEKEDSVNSCDPCEHVKGIQSYLSSLGACLMVDVGTVGTALCDVYNRCYGIPLSTYIHTRPRVRVVHNDSIAVISEVAAGTIDNIQFVPVRKFVRGRGGYACAFCDTLLSGRQGCHHTRVIETLRKDLEREEVEEVSIDTEGAVQDMDVHGFDMLEEEDTRTEPNEDTGLHKSYLPVSPVNCSKSLNVDEMVCACARREQRYVLTAPPTCQHCNSHRNPNTRGNWERVIVCTIGPCILEVETFRCSNEDCGKEIESEGREHAVLIHKTTAATHGLLRRELMGVVLSNGTLNSRLNHFHSQVTSLMHAKIIPPSPEQRSTRTLHNLCHIMLKLMTMSPEKSLFSCSTCDETERRVTFRKGALCLDGINQGYMKRKRVSLQNVTENCQPFPVSDPSGNPLSCRPLTTLVRRVETVSIMLKAVRGKEIEVNRRNIVDLVAAVRICSPSTLPPQFCSNSICGRTSNDYYEDIGNGTVIEAIRKVTKSLFHLDTLLYRLLKPLDAFISECIAENRGLYLKELGATQVAEVSLALQVSYGLICAPKDIKSELRRLEGMSFPSLILNGTCWLPEIIGRSSDEMIMQCRRDALRELLDLYIMFLKGPVTQFVRRSDVLSLTSVGAACMSQHQSPLTSLLCQSSAKDSDIEPGITRLLRSCRLLQASLCNIVQVERTLNERAGRDARQAFGNLFLATARSVQTFYSFYDNISSSHTAVKYASQWKIQNVNHLRENMDSRYPNHAVLSGTTFGIASRSGFYFPNHPQIRPLPFDADNMSPDREQVPCTKNYEQNQKCYTPGTVTASCFCRNSITYGYKILSRDEGTKTVLDTVISRFPSMPEWLIYDFSCGLYQTAVHSLWWAIEDTRIVSDKFHAKNHTCSPGFFPTVYTELDHANTVAHEQRNRGIAELCKSLRNSAQEFYIGLLAYHIIITNIRAKARSTTKYEHRDRLLSDYDVEWCFFHCLQLRCHCCETDEES